MSSLCRQLTATDAPLLARQPLSLTTHCPTRTPRSQTLASILFALSLHSAIFRAPGHGPVAPLTAGAALFALLSTGAAAAAACTCMWLDVRGTTAVRVMVMLHGLCASSLPMPVH